MLSNLSEINSNQAINQTETETEVYETDNSFNTQEVGINYKHNNLVSSFNFSKGVPRVVNTFCDLSLIYAYADELDIVDWKTVMAVAIDKKDSGAIGIL